MVRRSQAVYVASVDILSLAGGGPLFDVHMQSTLQVSTFYHWLVLVHCSTLPGSLRCRFRHLSQSLISLK